MGSGVARVEPVLPATYPLSARGTKVSFKATDVAGNTSTAVVLVSVIVQDTTAPVIAAHVDVTVEATSASGAVPNYTSPVTSDAVDGPRTATCGIFRRGRKVPLVAEI